MAKEYDFTTWGEARDYCKRFGLEIHGNLEVFEIAEALLRAFTAGQKSNQQLKNRPGSPAA